MRYSGTRKTAGSQAAACCLVSQAGACVHREPRVESPSEPLLCAAGGGVADLRVTQHRGVPHVSRVSGHASSPPTQQPEAQPVLCELSTSITPTPWPCFGAMRADAAECQGQTAATEKSSARLGAREAGPGVRGGRRVCRRPRCGGLACCSSVPPAYVRFAVSGLVAAGPSHRSPGMCRARHVCRVRHVSGEASSIPTHLKRRGPPFCWAF